MRKFLTGLLIGLGLVASVAYAAIIGVQQGGTGKATLFTGVLIGQGISPIVASSTPTLAGITATSTTASSSIERLNVTQLSVTSTSATSTFSNGIDLTRGCFSFLGICVSSSGSGTVNTGATGQVAFYTDNGTAISATSSLFFATSSNAIGVGTTTPGNLFAVQGNSLVSGTSTVGSLVATGTVQTVNLTVDSGLGIGTTTQNIFRLAIHGNSLVSGSSTVSNLIIASSTVQINSLTYVWPSVQGAASTFLQNNGSGGLTWAASAGGTCASLATLCQVASTTLTAASSSIFMAIPGAYAKDIHIRAFVNNNVDTVRAIFNDDATAIYGLHVSDDNGAFVDTSATTSIEIMPLAPSAVKGIWMDIVNDDEGGGIYRKMINWSVVDSGTTGTAAPLNSREGTAVMGTLNPITSVRFLGTFTAKSRFTIYVSPN